MKSNFFIIAVLWLVSIYYTIDGVENSYQLKLKSADNKTHQLVMINNRIKSENKKIQEKNQSLEKACQELTSKYNKLKTKYGLTDEQPVNTNKSGIYYEVFKD